MERADGMGNRPGASHDAFLHLSPVGRKSECMVGGKGRMICVCEEGYPQLYSYQWLALWFRDCFSVFNPVSCFYFSFYICSILVDPVGGIARLWAWGFRWFRNKDRSGYPPTSHSNSILQIDIKKRSWEKEKSRKKIFPKAMDLAAFERSVRDSRTDSRYLLSQSDKICSFDTRIMNIGMMR